MNETDSKFLISLNAFLIGIIILVLCLFNDGIGTVADWLSALGTILAVIVSLWLASDNRKKFHWDYSCSLFIYENKDNGDVTDFSFHLNGYNDSEKYEALKTINLIYKEGLHSLGTNIEIRSHEIIDYDFQFSRIYKEYPLQSKMFHEVLERNDLVTIELIMYNGNTITEEIKPIIMVQ